MNVDIQFASSAGNYATARRGGIEATEVEFIRVHLRRGVPVRHISQMLRRPLADVQAWVEIARGPPAEPEADAYVPVEPKQAVVVLSLWRGLLQVPAGLVTLDGIAREVAAHHGLTLDQIRGQSRKYRHAHPRQEAMWRMMQVGKWSSIRVGRYFDGRDHSTVLHACKAHAARLGDLEAAGSA